MKARRDAEKMSRNLIARQSVNMVVKFALAVHRGAAGDGSDKFFQLANTHFNIVGNRVDLGPVARRKNYSATSVRRQPAEMLFKRMGRDCDTLQEFNWSVVDVQACKNEIQFNRTCCRCNCLAGYRQPYLRLSLMTARGRQHLPGNRL